MQIWDTAGQERYRALGPVYYRNTSAAILVYDCARNLETSMLDDWLGAFRDVVGVKIPVFVVANKIDLFEVEPDSIAVGERWAETNGLKFVKASAKTGYNVKMLFEMVLSVVSSMKCADESFGTEFIKGH
jgi:small GTP-binding protein